MAKFNFCHLLNLFGEWFEIQHKENGLWERLSIDEKYMVEGECITVFTAIAYILDAKSKRADVVTPWFYGKNLERGIYRLVKTFSFDNDNKEKQDTAFVEFEIR